MTKSPTLIAIAILAMMLGACASTNDTADRPEHTTRSNDNPTELPSHAERQDQIAYTDISESASTKDVIVTEKPVLESSSSVTYPTDQTLTSSTTVDTTATPSSSLNTTTTTTTTTPVTTETTSMTSSSTTDDTDTQEDTATASRTRMRKD